MRLFCVTTREQWYQWSSCGLNSQGPRGICEDSSDKIMSPVPRVELKIVPNIPTPGGEEGNAAFNLTKSREVRGIQQIVSVKYLF